MIPHFHAQAKSPVPAVPGRTTGGGISFSMGDALPILGACLALGVVLAITAKIAYSRRRRKRHSRTPKPAPEAAKVATESSGRGRRREHRPRNPTLSETGGLPPVRDGQPPTPAS